MLAQRNLSGVKIKIQHPHETFAKEHISIQVLFHNTTDEHKYAISLKDATCQQNIFVYNLPPQSRVLSTYTTTYPRRGVVRWKKLPLETIYPFGLFQNKISLSTDNKLYVLPAILRLENFYIEYFARHDRNKQLQMTNNKTSRDSFSRLRDYVQGDNPRYIDWKASAKKDDLIVRQYVDLNPIECSIAIHFDMQSQYTTQQNENFENIIVLAASLTSEIQQQGRLNDFIVGDKKVKSTKLKPVLRFLTELKIQDLPFTLTKQHKNLIVLTNRVTKPLKEFLQNSPQTTLILTQKSERYVNHQYVFFVRENSIRLEKLC
ncbi:DUF58 domain-containing protein [Candidatus Uabimicrobium amorphum]|nr:DUF58 domain-containing protein [Candidatus Uabimicrobium amorphum]